MKIHKVEDFNIDCSMPQSTTFSISLRKLNGLILETVASEDGNTYLPANLMVDIQRIGLTRKGKILVNRVPVHIFMEMTKMHYGMVSNGKGIGCYVNLGSLFLDEKDELQVSLNYEGKPNEKFYKISPDANEMELVTSKPKSIRMKISTLDANNQLDYSLRYDKSKDYERPVNNVEGIYLYSEKLDKTITHDDFSDLVIQFNRVVGNDIMFDFSTACVASVMFNSVEDIEKQFVAQIYKNMDTVPSSGRLQLPMANDHKELTVLVVERVTNPKAMISQVKTQIKEENERLKSVAKTDEKDAMALVMTGAVADTSSAEKTVKELETVEKVMDKQ